MVALRNGTRVDRRRNAASRIANPRKMEPNLRCLRVAFNLPVSLPPHPTTRGELCQHSQ